jgi:hypothetical protein
MFCLPVSALYGNVHVERHYRRERGTIAYIHGYEISKMVTRCKQLYSLTEIVFMLELETLPTDFSDLSGIVVFPLNTYK